MPLDPDAARVLELMRDRPRVETLQPEEARANMRAARAVTAPGPAGPIPLRLYRPLGSSATDRLPALVFFHGGGWVIGDLDTHDTVRSKKGKGKRTAGLIGGLTGAGMLIGGIASGGVGLAIGGASGAGAGTLLAGATGNRDNVIPAESIVHFRLADPLVVQNPS